MDVISRLAVVVALGMGATPALAQPADQSGAELPAYVECAPYARAVTGIQLYGDAYTWWDQAAGRYQRGHQPKPGAVMAFEPHGNMRLGHVAAVSKVIDSRTVLLRHANWSPIDGQRGQVEDDVRAVDVSPNNDWSQVRVWYDPIDGLGNTAWPVDGFIYPGKDSGSDSSGVISPVQVAAAAAKPASPSRDFLAAFGSLGGSGSRKTEVRREAPQAQTKVAPVDLLAQLGR